MITKQPMQPLQPMQVLRATSAWVTLPSEPSGAGARAFAHVLAASNRSAARRSYLTSEATDLIDPSGASAWSPPV